MNILFLTTKSSKSIDNGASIRTSAIMDALSGNDVTIISCEDIKSDYINTLPIGYKKYYSVNFSKQIQNIIENKNIDLVIADHLQTAPLIMNIKIRKILHLHNLESSLYHSISESPDVKNDFLFNTFMKFESKLINRLEQKCFPKFNTVIFPTKQEIQLLNERSENYYSIPNSAAPEIEDFIPTNLENRTFSTLCNPIWFFNRQSLKFIIRSSKAIHGSFIKPAYEKNLKNKLDSISMLLSWGTFQGGSKIKVITALAAGIPQVITEKDNFGLDLSEGQGALIATSKKDWIQKANILIKDHDMKKSLSSRGKKYIQNNKMSFKQVVQRYKMLLFDN
ncbi:hypothetical protein KAJ27_04015 [bacterium]|nr:hypothetical protein [bacterium]